MENKPKIIIHVSGGNIQWVASDRDVDIAIVDMDNILADNWEGDLDQIQIGSSDIAIEDAYSDTTTDKNDAMDLRIKDYLKENGFL